MTFVYIIGAQCTGKTTLSIAVAEAIKQQYPTVKCESLNETARDTLKLHGYSRDDVRNGGERCLELQRLIMEHQIEKESIVIAQQPDVVVSDRSGLDPLVYAMIYCDESMARQLQSSPQWISVKNGLKAGTVIVCEPVQEWLRDDGTRLMPEDWKEWKTTHEQFCRLLEENDIVYKMLSSRIMDVSKRTEFVLREMKSTEEEFVRGRSESRAPSTKLS